MTEKKIEEQPGAPLVEDQPDAAEVAAAVARAQDDVLAADPAAPAATATARDAAAVPTPAAAVPTPAAAVPTPAAAAAEPAVQPHAPDYTEPVLPEFLAPVPAAATAETAAAPAEPAESAAAQSITAAVGVAEQSVTSEPLLVSATSAEAASAVGDPAAAAQVAASDAAQSVAAQSVAAQSVAVQSVAVQSTAAPSAAAPQAESQPLVAPVELLPSAGEQAPAQPGLPLAGLYAEAPLAPEKLGNRVAGMFIALLGAVAFAVVYAGILLLFLAPHHSTATIFENGLVPYLLSPGFWGATLAFFFALLLVVLVVGRAGWWAYVLSSFLVGVAVWAASALGYTFSPQLISSDISQRALLRLDPDALRELLKLSQNWIVLLAGVAAREVAVWFGAWIGARGRKVTAKNKAAQAEYEEAVAALGATV